MDETILSDEELRQERRRATITFALGCLLAFTSGLTLTVNNFIVKAQGTDFGEIMAVRGILQSLVMFSIIAFEGLFFKIMHYLMSPLGWKNLIQSFIIKPPGRNGFPHWWFHIISSLVDVFPCHLCPLPTPHVGNGFS